jgi:predicted tellurium resistance membrane protein TerC
MAESKNKQKLSKDELHAENEHIRTKMHSRDMMTKEDSQYIVDSLKPKNLAIYALTVFLPIIGVPIIWKKQKQMKLRNTAVYVWTFVGIIIVVEQVIVALRYFNVIS